MNKCFTIIAFIGLVVTGCTLAPKYSQPASPVASVWPENSQNSNHATNVVADIGWRVFFQDARLQALIGLALTNNRDLRVAVLNVQVSQAQYRIQRANLFPQINANGSFTRQQTPSYQLTPGQSAVNNLYSVGIGTTSYELDLFGRVQSLKKQALENYFATGEARRNAQISLVAEVAVQYLTELEFNEQLAVARQTLASVQAAYDLNKQSYDVGNISELDLRTAEGQVESAKVSIANYEQLRIQANNALVLLVGETLPTNLPPVRTLDAQKLLTDLPPGLPSDLLQRRPDILEAEHQLKAANANIGAARAAFFPTISITANAGYSTVNGSPWNPSEKNFITTTGAVMFLPPQYSLRSPRLEPVAGRDVVALERTNDVLIVYLDDTPSGAAPYEFSIHFPQEEPKPEPVRPSTPATLKITAQIDGSDLLKITAAEATWIHRFYDFPSAVKLNGVAWNLRQTNVLVNAGTNRFLPSGVNFSTAKIVARKGRDLATMWAGNDALWVNFADNPNGADAYELEISFGR